MLSNEQWGGILASLILASIMGIWKWVIPPLARRFSKWLVAKITDPALDIIHTALKPVLDRIAAIELQFESNGGTSLRDLVTRLEVKTNGISRQIEDAELKRRARESLLLSENIAGWECDESGRLVYLSDQALRWVGYQMRDLDGDKWPTIIHPDDRERAIEWWESTCKRRIHAEMVQRYVSAERKEFRVKVTANPVFSSDGRLIAYVGTIERLP